MCLTANWYAKSPANSKAFRSTNNCSFMSTLCDSICSTINPTINFSFRTAYQYAQQETIINTFETGIWYTYITCIFIFTYLSMYSQRDNRLSSHQNSHLENLPLNQLVTPQDRYIFMLRYTMVIAIIIIVIVTTTDKNKTWQQ